MSLELIKVVMYISCPGPVGPLYYYLMYELFNPHLKLIFVGETKFITLKILGF